MFLSIVFLSFLGCEYDHGFIKFSFLPESLSWVKISSYGLVLAITFLVCNIVLQKECKRLNLPTKIADNIIILSIVGGIAGAKLFYTLETWNEWYGFSSFIDRFFSGAGLTWYGGFLLATFFIYLYSRRLKFTFLETFDFCTPALAIGYAVGRLSCFVSGDGCYGIKCPYDWPVPFAMSFEYGASRWQDIIDKYGDPNVVVYNTPLFESLFSFVLFLIFWLTRKKTLSSPGIRFFIFVAAHSVFRFSIEFIRLNPKDVFGITQAQFISIILFILSVSFLIFSQRHIFSNQKET